MLTSLSHIFGAIFGACGLFGFACGQPFTLSALPPLASSSNYAVSIVQNGSAASSSETTITTTVNGSTTTKTVRAPYGYVTHVISETNNGDTHTYASTTPLTEADVDAIQTRIDQEQAAVQADIQRMFQEQEDMFQNMQQMFQNF